MSDSIEPCRFCTDRLKWVADLEDQVFALSAVASAAIEANLILGTQQNAAKAFDILNDALCRFDYLNNPLRRITKHVDEMKCLG